MIDTPQKGEWPRIIAHCDMDAFFAAIEQRDNPELKHQPVAITNGTQASAIITCSYEARAYGIKTGMKMKDAKARCPRLIHLSTRPNHYAAISSQLMAAFEKLTPDIEVFSVDEAFLEFTHCRHLYSGANQLAKQIQTLVYETIGLPCSVGISGDKTTAKVASSKNKPRGICVIPPWEAEESLSPLPVTALCGVAKGTAAFLAKRGVFTCGQMKHIPISALSQRFGGIGCRIWWMAQGKDPAPLVQSNGMPKSVGCSKMLPPRTRSEAVIMDALNQLCERLGKRLRMNHLLAEQVKLYLHTERVSLEFPYRFPAPTGEGSQFRELAKRLISQQWDGSPARQCGIVATAVVDKSSVQLDMFAQPDAHQDQLTKLRDLVTERYGEKALMIGSLSRSQPIGEVISPAWQPTGARNAVRAKPK